MCSPCYDVIVVGGGPAGATAAYHLAQHDLAVAIVDKDGFPRVKPCGGGLTYRLVHRFPELNEKLNSYVLKRVDAIHFYAPDYSSLRYTYDEPLSLMIQRRDFDAMLIEQCQQAGVKVMAPSRVVDVTVTKEYVDLSTDHAENFRAKAIIGADGVNSVVARSIGLRGKWQRNQLMSSIVAECPIHPQVLPDPDTIYILFGFHGLGYGWLFPKGDLVNIGIAGMLAENKNTRMKTIFEAFVQALKTREILPSAFEPRNIRGGLIPIKGIIPKTQTDRVLLCGDAAGFVNAITGEGIYYAMVSGELAARSLAQALQAGDVSERALNSYQRAWQQEIGEEIVETVRIRERLLTKPRLTNTVVRTVSKHEGMKRTFTDYFVGKISHRDLKRSLMRHFLLQYLKLQTAKVFQSLLYLKGEDRSSR